MRGIRRSGENSLAAGGEREVGSELLLRADGTFEYLLAYGAADYSAPRKWRSDSGAVILTTAGKEQPPLRLLSSSSTRDAAIRIRVKTPNGSAIERNCASRTSGSPSRIEPAAALLEQRR